VRIFITVPTLLNYIVTAQDERQRGFTVPSQQLCRVARWYIFNQKIPNLGKFCRALKLKMLQYFIHIKAIWYIL
jgi:hypothetical protein